MSVIIENLCKCDFIRKYAAYGKKERGMLYQLTDLYSLFYLKFINEKQGLDEHYWSNLPETKRNAWAGYAFEQVCLHHIEQIRIKLGIRGVLTNISSWSCPKQIDKDGTEWSGAQIDLLLCRGDHVIDLCEMKYSKSEYIVTAEYENHLRNRTDTFAHHTKTKDALHNILVTTYGLRKNIHTGIFNSTVTMDALFEPSNIF